MLANMEYKRSKLNLSACRFCYCHLSVLHNIIQPMSYIHRSNSRFTNTNFECHKLRGFKLNMKWERNWAQAHLLSNVMLPPQVHIPNYFGQVVYPNILKCQCMLHAHTKLKALTIPNGHVWDYQSSSWTTTPRASTLWSGRTGSWLVSDEPV